MSLFDADAYLDTPVQVDPPLPPEEVHNADGSAPDIGASEPVAELSVQERVGEIVDAARDVPIDPEEPDATLEATLVQLDPGVAAVVVEDELARVADGVQVRPSESLWDGVVAQPAAVSLLRSAAMAPVHAYLLVGPPGSGKRAAARAFAASLLCPHGGCNRCDVCARCLAEIHPDLVVVEREGASISVDQAREIVRLAMRSPLEGRRKVLVLVDFHLVTNAAPTVLKILEEPPESTVFAVLAEHLPPDFVTIASRCVEVPFAALSEATITNVLVAEGIDLSTAQRAAASAACRLDRARLLVHDTNVEQRASFWRTAASRLDGSGAAAAVCAAEALALVDAAAVGPLEARQAEELATLESRLEITGTRGAVGARKDLADRHKRELKRLRDDELRVGLAILARTYRDAALLGQPGAGAAAELILHRSVELARNPNLSLFLMAMFAALPNVPGLQRAG
jgi:DNA polymerase III subunit delta'